MLCVNLITVAQFERTGESEKLQDREVRKWSWQMIAVL